jgi:hypothetical protein
VCECEEAGPPAANPKPPRWQWWWGRGSVPPPCASPPRTCWGSCKHTCLHVDDCEALRRQEGQHKRRSGLRCRGGCADRLLPPCWWCSRMRRTVCILRWVLELPGVVPAR